MDRLIEWVDALSERVARLALWLMLLVVGVGAFNALARRADGRFGTSISSNAYLELQWYLFAAIFLLGGAYTLRRGAHVRVDVVYDRLRERTRAWIDLVGHLLFLLPFCVFGLVVSWAPVVDSWQRLEGSPDPGGLPRYPVKTLVPLAFALLLLQGLAEVARKVRTLRAAPEAEDEEGPAPQDEGAPE